MAALVGFVLVVALTPREAVWAFAAYALLILAVAVATRIPPARLARRMVVEVPFVVFALLMPFIATGPRVDVGPLRLSEAGLWGAWALLAKGTLGVAGSVILGATTAPHDLVRALAKARLPQQLVQIAGFMVRYLDVVVGELDRMRVARTSRGFRARSVRQWPVLAGTLGSLFIRSYERGERVHLAMQSRGYVGTMPFATELTASRLQWAAGLALPATAATVLAVAWTMMSR